MGLLFVDSFDHYDIGDITRKWTVSSNVTLTTAGRTGSAVNVQGSLSKALGYNSSLTIGFAYNTNAIGTKTILEVYCGASSVIQLVLLSDGLLYITVGGSYLWSTTNSSKTDIKVNRWYYIELAINTDTLGASSFKVVSAELYINGALEASGYDYTYGPVTYGEGVSAIALKGGITSASYFDDCYVVTGTAPLFDNQIGVIYPDGTGAAAAWTGTWTGTGTGSANWELTNEHAPDDTDSYIYTTASGDMDAYNFDDIVSSDGTVLGAQLNVMAWKEGKGLRALTPICISGTTTNTDTTLMYLSEDSWVDYRKCYDTDPDTGTQWTDTGINNAQWGVRVDV